MTEKQKNAPGSGSTKPVPMKLFAAFETDRSSPTVIPRLCSFKISRLVVIKPLDSEVTSIFVAVKIQSSKRTLRSSEIILPSNGLIETDLDLSFTLQYPHFLKRDINNLHIMLQRRKRYRNRTILGYKTLASGLINISKVLQKSTDEELNLTSQSKEKETVAKVTINNASSFPVKTDEHQRRKGAPLPENDRSPEEDFENFEEEPEDYWSNEDLDMSDSDEEARKRIAAEKGDRPKRLQQLNIKQRIVSLLKKIRTPGEEEEDRDDAVEIVDEATKETVSDDDFAGVESASDSGPEVDTLSLVSTPKPSLRPFFTGRVFSQDMLDETTPGKQGSDVFRDVQNFLTPSSTTSTSAPHSSVARSRTNSMERKRKESKSGDTTAPGSDTPGALPGSATKSRSAAKPVDRKMSGDKGRLFPRKHSISNGEMPRKSFLDMVAKMFENEDWLPDTMMLVDGTDPAGQSLATHLSLYLSEVVCTCSGAENKVFMSRLVDKVQRLGMIRSSRYSCNTHSRAPEALRIVLVGNDRYVNSLVRAFVEQFSAKPPDWQNYLKFFVVPLGSCNIARFICTIDNSYQAMFGENSSWRETLEEGSKSDPQGLVDRIKSYLDKSKAVLAFPVAEAMITFKDKGDEEESSQVFIPFLNDVRIGTQDFDHSISEDMPSNALSPPSIDRLSPPNSPSLRETAHLTMTSPPSASSASQANTSTEDTTANMSLLVDYWVVPSNSRISESSNSASGGASTSGKKDAPSSKSTLKLSALRSLHVSRLPQNFVASSHGDLIPSTFSMVVVTREKKQKISVMRLGKKSKDQGESKSQVVDGISRLICSSKSSANLIKVTVDGTEFNGVKFFQITSQWQTHIKYFPVAIFSYS